THGRGDRAAGGHDPERIPVPFPDSHSIPTLISSEFPRIDVCGRALRKDEKAPAIQDDVYLEGGRVDVGGCGPPQPATTEVLTLGAVIHRSGVRMRILRVWCRALKFESRRLISLSLGGCGGPQSSESNYRIIKANFI